MRRVLTPGTIDFGITATNGTPGIVRSNATIIISGDQAKFDALEKSMLYQYGSLTISDGKVYESPINYFRNAGDMTLRGPQFLLRNGEYRNDGPLLIDADSYLAADFFNALTGEVTIEGVVDANTAHVSSAVHLLGGVFKSESITLGNDGAFTIEGGSLLTEMIGGSLLVDSGVFAPGQSIGTADVFGDFTQSSRGTLLIEWDANGSDLVQIANTANLAGTLELSLLNGFVPKLGDTIEILNAANIIGGFEGDIALTRSFAAFAATLRQENNSLLLEVTAVPLPPALWLFGSVVIGLCAARRREA